MRFLPLILLLALSGAAFARTPLPNPRPEFAEAVQAPAPAPPVVNVNVPPAPPVVVTAPPAPTWWDTARDTAQQVLLWTLVALLGIVGRYAVPIGAALAQYVADWAKSKGIEVSEARKARIQDVISRGITAAAAAPNIHKDAAGKVVWEDKGKLVDMAVKYTQEHALDDIVGLGSDPEAKKVVDALAARAEVALSDPAVPVNVASQTMAAAPAPTSVLSSPEVLDLVRREVAAALADAHNRSAPVPETT